MIFRKLYFAFLFVLIIIIGCSSSPRPTEPATQERDELLAQTLQDPAHRPVGPVHNDYFTPNANAGPARHDFNGKLHVDEFVMQDTIPANTPRSENGRYFPSFTADFFTYDDYLVPANREIMPSTDDNGRWQLIFSPGKIWSEPMDEGLSRAAFPFVLTSRTSNEAHNGLATFLYDDDTVSQLFFQIIQETAAWNRNDYWGQTELTYAPGAIADEADLRAQFTTEQAAQLPIHPWSELANEANNELLTAFNGGLAPEDISATGLIIDGTIYMQPNMTRYGEFPYGRYMRHGVFSVTKSMGAAVAMLRLAQKYGDDVYDLKIADYVAVTAEHNGWDDVTFGDALSMATGIGDTEPNRTSSNVIADEDQDKFLRWMAMDSAAEKLDGAFAYNNHDWGPGEVVRYNSINTFVLSAAMDAFLKSKEGPDADIWQMVMEGVYQPIGIYHAPIMRTYEPNGRLGLPIFGYGLYPTVDDTVKITMLLHNGGQHNGEQLLSPTKLTESLYQTEEQGISVYRPNQYGESRYLHSFWSIAYCTDNEDCFQVPYMMGYGGNLTLLLPNGVTAFRYADAHNYDVEPMADLGTAVRSQE